MSDILLPQTLVGLNDQTGRLTGTFTSLADCFINLKKYINNIRIKTYIKMTGTAWFDLCLSNNHFGSKQITLSGKPDKKFDAEIIICSARFLIDVSLFNLKVKCKKLIILDSFDVACNRYFPDKKFNFPFKFDEYYFLANKANLHVFDNSYEYYHTFSSDRMDSIIFKEKHFYYTRKQKWYIKNGKKSWFENIGKGIFERLYKDVKVHYNIRGMTQKDGLYYYLKLFDVDGTKNHYPLEITKDDIKDKLFMKENDLLLDLI